MAKAKDRLYPQAILDLMAETSGLIMKARTLADLGMPELAVAAWRSAASLEEEVAPLLDTLDRDREAAVHRVSAASCYQHAGEFSRAVNLYRAALAGPLLEQTRGEVEQLLADCLSRLARSSNGTRSRPRKKPVTPKP